MFARAIESIRRRLFDRCVLRPSRNSIDHGDQQQHRFSIEKWDIEAFFRASQGDEIEPDLLIIKFPGTAGRAERATEFPMPNLPATVHAHTWTWNPPGYGGSSGRASTRNIAAASVGWCQSLLQQSNAQHVWLTGNSLGCATAMNVAANLDFESRSVGLLLRNPPPLGPVFCGVANRYPLGSLAHPWANSLVEAMDVMKTAPQIGHPAAFLHCELDRLVPIDLQQKVVSQYKGPTHSAILNGLDHGGVATDEHYPLINEAISWLWNQTKSD